MQNNKSLVYWLPGSPTVFGWLTMELLGILAISGPIFMTGLYGLVIATNVIRVVLSLEITILASVINFCCFSDIEGIGEILSMTAIIISGVFASIMAFLLPLIDQENACIFREEQK
jgi:NADH:ubiquinone oxidoreductase subunit K